MKNYFRIGMMSLSLLLLPGCALFADKAAESVETKEEKKETAMDLLNESKEEMRQMKGYRWDFRAKQQMEIPGESKDPINTLTGTMEFLDENRHATEMDMKVDAGDLQERMQVKVIWDGNTNYIQNKEDGRWIRQPESVSEVLGGNHSGYMDAEKVLDQVLTHGEGDVTMEKGEGVRKLTLKLDNHKQIEPFVEYAMKNFRNDDKVKAEGVTFSDFKLELSFDESTKRLTQINQDTKLSIPFIDGVTTEVDQSFAMKLMGEVKEIPIPEEAKNAIQVNE